ncbi:hypothetical protein [Gloeocapsopsis sp. IPPAS B-1203]|uniref:hypothetical protein n=1 Tax=Gloeocapsopsis sp. IPPAS B-1203 TaxID=2049454 RepID=UPI00117D116B|nr:hypothetical protein [Gloeocapsopsis sp. IPPAS B-1203]
MRRPLISTLLVVGSSMLFVLPPSVTYAQSPRVAPEAVTNLKASRETRVGIAGDKFTINGQPTFLLGVSYFDAVHWRESDLDRLAEYNFNLIRVFLDWRNRGFFDEEGNLTKSEELLALVRAANDRGIVVDVTITGYSEIPRDRAVQAAVRALRNEPNVIFDLQNEHNLGGEAALSHSDIRQLYFIAKAENARAIIFTSNYAAWMRGNTLNPDVLTQEVKTGIDVIAPHFTRNSRWYGDTGTRVAQTKEHLRSINSNRPVYVQEDHRNGWRGGDFTKEQFLQAAQEAKTNGAAGWVFHTDAGFSLIDREFFAELDATERQVIRELGSAISNSTAYNTPID